jgi:hypothetical protein
MSRKTAPARDGLDGFSDEMHLEMASREFVEIEIIHEIVGRIDVAVGIIGRAVGLRRYAPLFPAFFEMPVVMRRTSFTMPYSYKCLRLFRYAS